MPPSRWFIIEDTTYKPGSDADDSCIIDVGVDDGEDENEAIARAIKNDEQVKRGQCSSNPKDWKKTGTGIRTDDGGKTWT